jgi:peptide/nickel transport system permease protein
MHISIRESATRNPSGVPAIRPGLGALRRLSRNTGATVGALLLVALIAVALLAPVLAPRDPVRINPPDALKPPGNDFWFGTDQFGRDVFSRVIWGARISLRVGVIAVLISVGGGVPLGLAAGYYGGWLDMAVMRLIDLLLAFPGILLALVVVTILGPGLSNVMLAVGIYGIPSYARVVRGSVLVVRGQPFVEAAQALGCPTVRVVVRHLLPNVVAPIIVLSSLNVAGAILTSAALSFLGLGAQPPTPEWGALLNAGRDWVRDAWWLTTFPGLAIMLTVLAINMLGDGLRDVLDPQLRD